MLAAPVRWPRPSRLAAPLQPPSRKLGEGLAALGVSTLGELLEHLPRDRREARTVAELRAGEQATVAVRVRSIASRQVRTRGMRGLVEATVFDDSGSMRATFFNQPWLVEELPAGHPAGVARQGRRRGALSRVPSRARLHGRRGRLATGEQGGRRALSAAARRAARAAAPPSPPPRRADPGGPGSRRRARDSLGRPLSGGGGRQLDPDTCARARGETGLADVPEPLAAGVRASERLPERGAALAAIHFGAGELQAREGLRRLAFDELLLCQLAFLVRRGRRAERAHARALSDPPTLSARWLAEGLPFELTGDQRRAIERIGRDLERRRPMQRLLMGDVGSGKTVVALHAMLRAVEHGAQAALMAPTETLAEQHFATVQRLLGGESVRCELLTGSTSAKRREQIVGRLASGELSLLIGTHALIEPDVRFRELAVAVVDEQHRFGVRQRSMLESHDPSSPPHMLHMTATPIPRTLALARYGDLDRSVLRELPRGRQPIDTRIVAGEQARAEAYRLLREQLEQGRQAYVVCPLVEEGEQQGAPREGEARAAAAELERLRAGELAGHAIELLHGQMRPREKQAAMAAFASGQASVLVATTVIEVGVDVPNATVMLVENAERFGISQLHQLRGRVGRGEHPSTCLLASTAEAAGSLRLRVLARHGDGFRLAEIDLRLRREGELIGTRQSGLGQFKFASLPEHDELLERARAQAEAILAEDPELCGPLHGLLGEALRGAYGEQALLPIPA